MKIHFITAKGMTRNYYEYKENYFNKIKEFSNCKYT